MRALSLGFESVSFAFSLDAVPGEWVRNNLAGPSSVRVLFCPGEKSTIRVIVYAGHRAIHAAAWTGPIELSAAQELAKGAIRDFLVREGQRPGKNQGGG